MSRLQNDGPPLGGSPEIPDTDARQYQHLWFSLASRSWSSLVLVPADGDGSADEVALRLAEVGKQLSRGPVTAITVNSLAYDTATALADLPNYLERARPEPSTAWSPIEMPPSSLGDPDQVEARPTAGPTEVETPQKDQSLVTVSGLSESRLADLAGPRLIISIPPVVTQPLGLATARNADLVVVCVEAGRTRIARARWTLDLVGRERVAGCFLIHRGAG
jgi:nucleotide-binding universal stress UspA family protein